MTNVTTNGHIPFQVMAGFFRAIGRRLAAFFRGRRFRCGDIAPCLSLLVLLLMPLRERWVITLGFSDTAWLCGVSFMIIILPGYWFHRTIALWYPQVRQVDRYGCIPSWIVVFLQWFALGSIVLFCLTELCRGLGASLTQWMGVILVLNALLIGIHLVLPDRGGYQWRLNAASLFKPVARRPVWCIDRALLLLVIGVAVLLMWGLHRTGSFSSEDALVHLAHVHDLLEHDCLDVADPLYGGERIDSRYADSVFHPYLAMVSRFSAVSYTRVWHELAAMLLPCVLFAIGVWVSMLFQSRRVGLCAAFAFAVVHGLLGWINYRDGDLLFLAYPGGIALYLLIPLVWYHLWAWRLYGSWLECFLAMGLVMVTAATHLFYALLLVGGAWLVLPIIAVWIRDEERAIRIRTLLGAVLLIVPLALSVWERSDAINQVENPFFVKALTAVPPDHHDVVVSTHNSAGDGPIRWRVQWPRLLQSQGIRLFPSPVPIVTLIICLPLLVLVYRRSPAAVYVVVLTLFPLGLNCFPFLLQFLNERISIHKVIRLGQFAPHAVVLGWGLERILTGVEKLAARLHGGGGDRVPQGQVCASVILVFCIVVYELLAFIYPKPLIEIRQRIVAASEQPLYDDQPYRNRNAGRDSLLEFFARYASVPRAVLSHSEDSLLLAAYHGYNVALVPSYHASPSAADAKEREIVTGRILRGQIEADELMQWLAAKRIDLLVFYHAPDAQRNIEWIQSEGRELLDRMTFLKREEAPAGYDMWRVVFSETQYGMARYHETPS